MVSGTAIKAASSTAKKGWFFKTAADGTRSVRTQSKWIMGGAAGVTALTPLGPVLAGRAGETAGGLVGGVAEGLTGIGMIPISSSFASVCIVFVVMMMVFASR